MKKPWIIVAAVVVIAGFALVLASSSKKSADSKTTATQQSSGVNGIDTSKNPSNGPVATDKVTIKDFAFGPKVITVKKGTKVTWTNQDSAHHDITPDTASDDFKAGPLLAKGESYSFTFNATGTFSYHCSPHPYMKASVQVIE